MSDQHMVPFNVQYSTVLITITSVLFRIRDKQNWHKKRKCEEMFSFFQELPVRVLVKDLRLLWSMSVRHGDQ
jgi:hypothetical protein